MEREHLHLLITEEIYKLSQDENKDDFEQSVQTEEEVKPEEIKPTAPTQADKDQEVETTTINEKEEETPAHIEIEQESPEIPKHDLEDPGEIPFAVFHSSTNTADIDLLHKIIDACKLPEEQYKIFGGGFDQSVHFKKALVFVPEAKAFYTPIPYKNSEFLCSKPLDQISGDVQEKAKLWSALQKFVLGHE